MNTKSILVVLFAVGILFTSCKKNDDVTPSNTVTTVNKTITGYSQLNVSDPFKVYVTFSDTEESIQIEANQNLQQYINCEKKNNQLVIDIDDNIDIKGTSTLNVYITTKQLDAFYAAGATTIQLQNELNGGNVSVELTGACTLNGTMFVNDLNIDITGASNLNISGTSASVDLDATGASNLKDYGFETNNFTCDLEGGCNVNLTVQQSLNVKANGASNVYYKGNGTVSSQ
ncbi:MAG: hypothetical protein C0591_12590, partial [Marinilabiliales bacterium]